MKLKKIVLPLIMFFLVSCFGNITQVHADEAPVVLPTWIVIEKPEASSLVGGDVDISGYALSTSTISKIEVYVDEVLKGQAVQGIERKDIGEVLTMYTNALNCGFSFKLNSRALEDGAHKIKVVVTDAASASGEVIVQMKNQRTPIMGQTVASREQMIRYFQNNSIAKDFKYINEFVSILIEEAAAEGVRGDLVFAQMMKETNFLKFTGTVKDEQNNFAGIGATGGTVVGAYFPDVRTGIRAVIQHIKAYASTEPLKQAVVDPRFQYVQRATAPYAEWLGKYENPITGIGWATGLNYGYDIVYRTGIVNSIEVVKSKAQINDFAVPGDMTVNRTYLGTANAVSSNPVLYKFSVTDKSTGETTVLQEYSEKNTFSWRAAKTGKYEFIVQAKDEFSELPEDQSIVKEVEAKEAPLVKTIVLDAGHGGSDPGAIGNGYKEKDLNSRLVQKIGDKLKTAGYNVLYSKNPSEDVFVSLENRAKYANDLNADLFVSLHHDSAVSTSAGGTSVFYSSYRPGIDDNDVYITYGGVKCRYIRPGNGGYYINYKGSEKFVSVDDASAYDSTPSIEALQSSLLASKLADVISTLGLVNRGTKDRLLYVTRNTNMASVLIETGFISNPTEAAKLADDSFQAAAADKIVEVINAFAVENLGAVQQVPTPKPPENTTPPASTTTPPANPKPPVTPAPETPKPTTPTAPTAPTKPAVVNKGWVKSADGTWKYYDPKTGTVKTGWLTDGGKTFYFDSKGVLKTGWVAIDGKKYNFNADGAMRTGWLKLSNAWYYFDNKGVMQSGWITISGKKYYMDANGIMKTGWVLINKKYYYFYTDGHMAVNTKIGKYKVGKDGARL